MREIKFRAWDNIEGKMEYTTDYIKEKYGPNDYVMQYTGLKDKNWKEIYEGDIVEYNSTVKYFDGNILSTHFLTEVCFDLGGFCEKIIKYEVEKKEDEFYEKWLKDLKNEMMKGYIAMAIYDNSGKIQKPVIGDIYENPELIS